MPNRLVAAALEWIGFGERYEVEDEQYEPRLVSESYKDPHPEGVIPLHRQKHDNANCPIVRAEPTTMDEATAVADEIKRQVPVLLNLEETPPEEARRIRDFLGGVTYGLNGYMRKIGSWVYVCSPWDMPVEKLILDASRRGADRYEDEFAEAPY